MPDRTEMKWAFKKEGSDNPVSPGSDLVSWHWLAVQSAWELREVDLAEVNRHQYWLVNFLTSLVVGKHASSGR
jgi:hypothetical protein